MRIVRITVCKTRNDGSSKIELDDQHFIGLADYISRQFCETFGGARQWRNIVGQWIGKENWLYNEENIIIESFVPETVNSNYAYDKVQSIAYWYATEYQQESVLVEIDGIPHFWQFSRDDDLPELL